MKAIDPKLIKLTPEILSLTAEIDEFKGRWTATQALAPDRLAALRQIATIESVGSSTRIEGVKLTNSEIESLLRGVKSYSFRSRDEQEVAGYAEVMETIFSSYRDIPLTENHILQLHSVLLKYSTKDERHRGAYKKFANSVVAVDGDGKTKGVIFESASPFDTPKLTQDLIQWANAHFSSKDLHPLLVLAIFVLVFLQIHPFQDGNGRISRALTTLILLQQGYTYVPYSSFERVIEENKDGYYLSLRRGQSQLEGKTSKSKTQADGVSDWIVFFLKSMQKQKATLEQKLKDELAATKIPKLSLQIIELIKSRGPSSVAEVVAAIGANRNTVKKHFQDLVADGHLAAQGKGRGVRYGIKFI